MTQSIQPIKSSKISSHSITQIHSPISIEFFPPKTPAGFEKLLYTQQQLKVLQPSYYSVTYGAGGSTHAGTWHTITEFHRRGLDVAPHLSCIGATKETIKRLIFAYRALGIKRIVALRGDMPSGMAVGGELPYAQDLVELIRQETGNWFEIEVAAYPEMHPQAINFGQDIQHFINKVKAGANGAITQYFYSIDSFFAFKDVIDKHLDIPITAGIMPIQNVAQLLRFSQACGAEIPRWLKLRLQDLEGDEASLKAFANDFVAQLCAKLLENNIPIHFYTLNQSQATLAICQQLGLIHHDLDKINNKAETIEPILQNT